ncbi:AzlC family ABC transporter permease [Nocardioides sp. HDW12B]|uniref:AzlC family ABC transporter permease n=1 Tax=Nocardioides sp. HDW12B TaxID=2714939 RepID=UPI001980BCFE|nr:AzlC family ABC transporter permease [Nocardioides sp. HDW12B]
MSSPRGRIVGEALAVGLATGAYGISFGAISVTSGLDVWQTCALSLLVFTGASQFALVGVLASGGTPAAAAGTALLLGVRNGLYGLRLAPLLAWRGTRRVVGAHLLIDESTAMAVNRDTTTEVRLGFVATGLSVFVLWNLATLGGALAGEQLGDPRTYGLDAAVGGAFLALLWPRLSGGLARGVAVVAAAVALGLVPLVTPGLPVLAAASVALLGLLPRRGERARNLGGAR